MIGHFHHEATGEEEPIIGSPPSTASSKRTFSSMSQSNDEDSDSVEESQIVRKARKPMRKRAKTQEEKEQRQQERIMRNRAAAQVSRERKREYVTQLEAEKADLCDTVKSLTSDNTKLRTSVDSLTARLESMERTLQYFMPQGTNLQSSAVEDTSLSTTNELPLDYISLELTPPPGTIRPQDLLPGTSINQSPEALDLRNPAAIANDPQRRSRSFPWTLSSQAPIYQHMENILLCSMNFYRDLISTVFVNHLMISLKGQQLSSGTASLPDSDHWRLAATGRESARMQKPRSASSIGDYESEDLAKFLLGEENRRRKKWL